MESKQPNRVRKRLLRNRFSVKLGDILARLVITIGGVSTILAVCGVFAFLAWVVVPLFLPAKIEKPAVYRAAWSEAQKPLHVAVDEYQVLGWGLFPDGQLRVFDLATGKTVHARKVVEDGPQLTAAAFSLSGGGVALGFADGTVRLGRLGFKPSFPQAADLDDAHHQLQPGQTAPMGQGVLQHTAQGEFRLQEALVELEEPVAMADAAITLIDYLPLDRGPLFAVHSADGQVQLSSVRSKENLLTGEITLTARKGKVPFEPRAEPPEHLLLNARGDSVLVIWGDGWLRRYAARNLNDIALAEERGMIETPGASLSSVSWLLGRTTLLVGDSTGQTTAWFGVRPEPGEKKKPTVDGTHLVAAHRLPGPDAAVTAIASSPGSRMAAIGYANGEARLFYVTTSRELARATVAEDAAVRKLLITPKDDALFAVAGEQVWQAALDPRHPEASLSSLFTPVWYESYAKPDHVWQSGGGTEDLEPKLGLWPLVFGTIKATFYSMLFGVPIALLAAIYTSEFMHARTRAKIKPTIELMASLPSVVLGFLAALVFAPLIEKVLPAALASFVTVPTAFLLGAYFWQLLPYQRILRLQRWRLLFIAPFFPLGLAAAYYLGPVVENRLFGGDIMRWLDGQIGTGTGGWMLLMLPLSAAGVFALMATLINPWVRSISHEWPRQRLALATLIKFLAGAAFALALALVVSWSLAKIGWDPRGSFVGKYDQRNALVVGFVMGFAIIPIIFTIADDALSTVPQHLRSGSLGAGATQWQTAVRIVIPTAMSGLFSAVMIGLGRAVGETMIVLMAAGNTPLRDWNVFNGFRTLSANIAVELPEAPLNSTHYRTLFLAALTLFILTFLVNTVAEVVRLRFRRRAYQL